MHGGDKTGSARAGLLIVDRDRNECMFVGGYNKTLSRQSSNSEKVMACPSGNQEKTNRSIFIYPNYTQKMVTFKYEDLDLEE